MKFIVVEKQSENGLILVITDEDILNKTFEEGKKQLDLTKGFYQGEKRNKEEVIKKIRTARLLHLTGKEAVSLGIELNLIDLKQILIIQDIPHAEVVLEL